jgi:hypothetical protein
MLKNVTRDLRRGQDAEEDIWIKDRKEQWRKVDEEIHNLYSS